MDDRSLSANRFNHSSATQRLRDGWIPGWEGVNRGWTLLDGPTLPKKSTNWKFINLFPSFVSTNDKPWERNAGSGRCKLINAFFLVNAHLAFPRRRSQPLCEWISWLAEDINSAVWSWLKLWSGKWLWVNRSTAQEQRRIDRRLRATLMMG